MSEEPILEKAVAGAPRSLSVWRFRLLMFSISLVSGLAVVAVMVVILRLSLPEEGTGSIPAPLPIQGNFGSVPDVELTERSGQSVRLGELRGKVWVAGFIFTRCHETCPMVTGVMARLRAELPSDVQLVSFTVDPRYDSPDVLRDYARNYKAGDDWWFLTGPREALYELINDGFKLGVRENPDPEKLPGERIIHSTRLVVVDREGQIRGYYDSTDPGLVRALVQNVKTLRNEE